MSDTNPQGQDPASAKSSATGSSAGGNPPAGNGQDLSGIMEENVDIGSLVANAGNMGQQQQMLSGVKIPPHPNTTFDEQKFLSLLAGSISLTVNEKRRIIDAIPQLSQFQIDELIKIFEEEKQKFDELEKKHAEQIAELEKQHAQSWQDLESKTEEDSKKKKEEEEAEQLRKSLGI